MAIEVLFWLGVAAVAAFFAIRLVHEVRRQVKDDDRLAESFERQKTVEFNFSDRDARDHWRGAA